MGKPVTGEVVVFPFPQTNLQSGKRRPALVVAGEDSPTVCVRGSARLWSIILNTITADPDFGCAEWPGGVDLCPDALHQAVIHSTGDNFPAGRVRMGTLLFPMTPALRDLPLAFPE